MKGNKATVIAFELHFTCHCQCYTDPFWPAHRRYRISFHRQITQSGYLGNKTMKNTCYCHAALATYRANSWFGTEHYKHWIPPTACSIALKGAAAGKQPQQQVHHPPDTGHHLPGSYKHSTGKHMCRGQRWGRWERTSPPGSGRSHPAVLGHPALWKESLRFSELVFGVIVAASDCLQQETQKQLQSITQHSRWHRQMQPVFRAYLHYYRDTQRGSKMLSSTLEGISLWFYKGAGEQNNKLTAEGWSGHIQY